MLGHVYELSKSMFKSFRAAWLRGQIARSEVNDLKLIDLLKVNVRKKRRS